MVDARQTLPGVMRSTLENWALKAQSLRAARFQLPEKISGSSPRLMTIAGPAAATVRLPSAPKSFPRAHFSAASGSTGRSLVVVAVSSSDAGAGFPRVSFASLAAVGWMPQSSASDTLAMIHVRGLASAQGRLFTPHLHPSLACFDPLTTTSKKERVVTLD